jgi:hypothetical protein
VSAWIVSKGHIDCLVQSLIAEGLATFADADEVGQMLWHENHLSIQARYGDEPDTPLYHFTGVEAPLDDAIVYKQAQCYDYQSCEHAAWESSEAYKLNEALSTILADRNGGTDALWGRSGQAPWGIEHIEQAVVSS